MLNFVFPYELSVVAIIRDEAIYMQEWLDYHILAGVDKFYIYDNGSKDNISEILQPYIDENIVEYCYIDDDDFDRSKVNIQIAAYNDAIIKHRYDTRYMMFIDIDEFVLPYSHGDILSVTESILASNLDAAGLVAYWRCFGSSGIEKIPNSGVLANYIYRGVDDFWNNNLVKTIANPRKIEGFFHAPHECIYLYGCCSLDENGNVKIHGKNGKNTADKIKINHYFVKSREDWELKMLRGRVDMPREKNVSGRNWEMFDVSDCNDVFDNDINDYIADIWSGIRGRRNRIIDKSKESNESVVNFLDLCSKGMEIVATNVNVENMLAFYFKTKLNYCTNENEIKVLDDILLSYVEYRINDKKYPLNGMEADMFIGYCHEEIYLHNSLVAKKIYESVCNYIVQQKIDDVSKEYFLSRLEGISSDSAVASYLQLEYTGGDKLLKKWKPV